MSTIINLSPSKYSTNGGSSWNDWGSGHTTLNGQVAYRFDLPASGAVSKPQTITVTYKNNIYGGSKSGTFKVYNSSSTSGSPILNESISFPASSNEFTEKSEDLSTLSFSYTSCVVSFAFTATGVDIYLKDPVLTVEIPDLQVSASPSDLYTGDTLSLNFTNRLSQTLNVKFYNGSTELYSINANGDALNVTPDSSWFTTAGVSGDSMTVTVRASDSYGRTSADVSFTLRKSEAGSVTLLAPISTTVNGGETINFSWSYSGPGTLTKTELQWSTDNANWTDIPAITGSGTTYPAPAYLFDVGAVYWRARVTNSRGSRSDWSNSVSFTVSYPTLSVGVSPSSQYEGSAVQLSFTNRLGRTLSVVLFYGTTQLYSTAANGNQITVATGYNWFSQAGVSGNSMQVKVRASDDLGRTSNDATFTLLKRTGGSISTIAPSSRQNGAETIGFSWSYSGDGYLTSTLLEWSTDNVIWAQLATVANGGTTYFAPAGTFPAGSLYWRGTATNSLGAVGSPSSGRSFSVYYDAVSQVVPVSSPTSGAISLGIAQTFSVALEVSGTSYAPFTIADASLFWRSGTSGDYTEAAMTVDGDAASVEIPANTFPAGTIQWYAEATDNTGSTTQTDVFTVTALISDIDASPRSPIGTIEANTGPIPFRWSYVSLDGSAQSKAELQYSSNGSTGFDFPAVVSGDATATTVPGGTLPSGTVYWRVRSYNSNDEPGAWSQAVSFTCYGAAVVQGVTMSSEPFAVITWQTTGQLAYKVEVDGVLFGPYAGADVRRFVLSEPLEDGLHSARVAVQNNYGLWSVWAEGQAQTENAPGDSITLTAADGESAALQWTCADSVREFCVYRDGRRIGKTSENTFVDRAASGTHSYYVINKLPGGYYTKSNVVTATGAIESPVIGLLSGGDFIELRLSESANRSQTIQQTREVVYVQYSGATYPEAEIGEHETLTASGDAAWTHEQRDDAAAFEALMGKPVIYKTPGGACVVGVLEGFQRRDPLFFKSYSFNVSQMDWEEHGNE